MENNIPQFVIFGSYANIHMILNKLPNKNKLNIDEPFIEYVFFLDRVDEKNNIGEFKILFLGIEFKSVLNLKAVVIVNNELNICIVIN
jgi:hypothetical protein